MRHYYFGRLAAVGRFIQGRVHVGRCWTFGDIGHWYVRTKGIQVPGELVELPPTRGELKQEEHFYEAEIGAYAKRG